MHKIYKVESSKLSVSGSTGAFMMTQYENTDRLQSKNTIVAGRKVSVSVCNFMYFAYVDTWW